MGAPKAVLEWHGSTLVRRVAGIVGRAAGPVVVVRAPGQALPPLPPDVRVAEDAREGRGPLQGLLAGLEALGPEVEVAYVSAVDVPLLHPRFVRRALAAVGPGADAAVACVGGRAQPLAAAYRREAALAAAADLLAEGRPRAGGLLDRLRVAWLDVGPGDGLDDLDAPADYAAARALPPPEVTVERGGVARAVRAATLGEALGAGAALAVTVDGEPVAWDPEHPLVAGDVVAAAPVSEG
jgi:molybdopterin-guanine dinucleotide biosynthesis protein A